MPGGILSFPPATVFIILRVSSNCFIRRLTSMIVVPLPLAIRSRRRALMISGFFALGRSHGVDDSLGLLEGILGYVDVLQRLAHAGYHRREVFEIAHFLDLCYLLAEIVEVELVLNKLLLSLRACSSSNCSCARSTSDTTSPMPNIRSAIRSGVEHLQGVHFFRRSK